MENENMRRRVPTITSFAFLVLQLTAQIAPQTIKQPITDEYHAVRVADNYRWLEDGSNAATKQWVAAQNAYSRSILDKTPYRDAMKRDILADLRKSSVQYGSPRYRRGTFFFLKRDPLKQQPFLVTMTSLDELSSERTLVDPNALNADGRLSIDWYVPSLDGSLVAVAMSEGGSEDASVYVYDVVKAKQVGEIVPRVNYPTGGGSVAWLPDNKSFFYTRYPQGKERPVADLNFYQQVYQHRLGAPASSDTYVIGKEFPRIGETVLDSDPTGRYFLASVANGDGGEFAHYLRMPDGRWRQITRFEDAVVSVVIGPEGALYLLSRKGAPRGRVLRMPVTAGSLADAKVIVPEGKASIEAPDSGTGDVLPVVTATRIYVETIKGGPNQIDVYDHSGKSLGGIPLKGPLAASNLIALEGDTVAFQTVSYLEPPAYFIFDGQTLRTSAVRVRAQTDLTGFEVERVIARSADGTQVPMNIIHRKGLQHDGATPALIYGYGGFGISLKPSYLASSNYMLWLEQGGILALTNLRGGGEYGEAWHTAGNVTHKQNVFDDFAACVRYLIDQKYTSPEHLAATGGSNGGLLMGAEITQHPTWFRAVVSHVGIYDMLRTELDPNGSFNVTEYGSVKDPAQFKALYAYSPYHRVDAGAPYPAVLFMTGDNDGRVNPAHSRKMVAALQAATASKKPILLRTSANAGHGIGSSLDERVDELADVYAFLFDQLGLNYIAKK
jgi:prolyl oligopeptidase